MKTNIIFLDIDGVICTQRSNVGSGNYNGLMCEWDVYACGLLRTICEKCNAKIVISSTWRLHYSHNIKIFEKQSNNPKLKFDTNLFKKLKNNQLIQFLHDDWRTEGILIKMSMPSDRGFEISKWLYNNKETVNDYFIIDDNVNDIVEYHNINKIIKTDYMDGFLFRDYLRIMDAWCLDEVESFAIKSFSYRN